MPYFISNTNPDCSGWAVEKEDGEVMGCHATKQDAIDQMVAISVAEDMEPGGERAINLDVPEYIKSAARKGLDYYGQKLAGAGVQAQTVREAREMASGNISEDKVIRANAWAARHLVDLDASKNSDANDEEFPGAGAVAFYLWGINPLDPQPAMDWFSRKAEAIKAEVRVADGTRAVICDIDGTLLNGSEPIQKTVDYVDELEGEIIIVTGRMESDRAETEAALNEAEVEYSRLIMNDDSSIATPAYKKATAEELLKTYNITLAIDNDEKARAAYRSLGIEVLNPADIPEPVEDEQMQEMKSFNFNRNAVEPFASVSGMTEQVETRRVTFNEFELRAAPQGNGMTFSGYAAVFNSDSEPLPFIERIAPGAFAKSLRSRNNIRMYMNHDSSMLLATTRAKTLRLAEDSKGLLVDADLPDTTVGRDLSVLMQRKDVDSMSFGFTVPTGGDRWSDDGNSRELRQVKLFEVSVVTGFPAYAATSASVRSLDALATRTGIDADQLAVAITALEAGQTLAPDHAALLRETVAKLEPQPQAAPASVGLMAKHLELLKNF